MKMPHLQEIRKALLLGQPYSLLHEHISPAELPDDHNNIIPRTNYRLPLIETAFFRLRRNAARFEGYAKSVFAFEKLSLKMREYAMSTQRPKCHVEGKELAKIIGYASSQKNISSIYLEGLIIEGDLNISDIKCDKELVLKGCLVSGTLVGRRSKFGSIDLSGSVLLQGIHATYLETERGLNLRRMASLGVLDFGACTIKGSIDAQDFLAIPSHSPNANLNWSARKAMVNFARSNLGGDLRIARGRIYGGLNLRAIKIGGSAFFNDLIVRSPLATVEKIVVDQIPRNYVNTRQLKTASQQQIYINVSSHVMSAYDAEFDLAYLVRRRDPSDNDAVRIISTNIIPEVLLNVKLPGTHCVGRELFNEEEFQTSLLGRLLFGNPSAQARAIGAEGAKISGGLFASGMRVGGRLKARFLEVENSTSFTGSHFRTFRSLRHSILNLTNDRILERSSPQLKLLCQCIIDNLDGERSRSNPLNPMSTGRTLRRQYCVDLRDSHFRNSVDFGKDNRNVSPKGREKLLVEKVVRSLVGTNEDPIKFVQVFYALPGNFKTLQKKEHSTHNSYKESLETSLSIIKSISMATPERYVHGYKEILAQRFSNLETKYKSGSLKGLSLLEGPMPPKGRLTDQILTEYQIQRLTLACQNLGPLKSTLLIGEISLSDATIDGSLRFFGFIANVFDRTDISATSRPILHMNSTTINGDLDFRDSVGISSIEAEQITITGSLRMSDAPVYDPKRDCFERLERRALLTQSPNYQSHEFTSYNFERAKISGDCYLLFDHERGPHLELSFLATEGRLCILPSRGGVELNLDEKVHERFLSWRERKAGLFNPIWHIRRLVAMSLAWPFITRAGSSSYKFRRWATYWQSMQTGPVFYGNKRLDRFIKNWTLPLRSKLDARFFAMTTRPSIDMTGVTTQVLSHSPSAWPQQDGLLIQGLRYDRSKNIGPLPSQRARWDTIYLDQVRNFRIISLAVVASILFLIFVPIPANIMNNFGPRNTKYALSLLVSLLALSIIRKHSQPNPRKQRPEALNYLALQRRHLSTSKLFFGSRPHQPYIHAAKVLRSAGHNAAADRVELERLRQRRYSLSMRSSSLLKIALKVTDLISHYGFKPMRVVVLALAVHSLGAMAAHYAWQNHLVGSVSSVSYATNENYRSSPSKTTNFRRDSSGEVPNKNPNFGSEDPPNEAQPGNNGSLLPKIDRRNLADEFKSPLYAIDLMLPFVDFDHAANWKIYTRPVVIKSWIEMEAGDSIKLQQSLFAKLLWWLPLALKVIGLTFTAIIAIAVVSRVETIMARNEDI